MFTLLHDRPWKRVLWICALLALLAVAYTMPLAFRMGREIPGVGSDLPHDYWCHWWFKTAAMQGSNPYFTDYLWYPNGSSLVFNTNRFGSAAAAALISPVVGETASYNILILVSFIASAAGFYFLGRELRFGFAGSLASAVVFAFCPYKLNKLFYHHPHLSTQTFGFVLLLALRILNGKGRKRHAVALGLLLALTAYESLFNIDLLLLALALVLAWYAIADKKQFWRRRVLTQLLLAAVAAGLALALLIVIALGALPDYGRLPFAAGAKDFSNDLLVLFAPSPMPILGPEQWWQRAFSAEYFVYRTPEENFGVIGWPALALACLGFFVARRSRRAAAPLAATKASAEPILPGPASQEPAPPLRFDTRLALVGAVSFAILSLGPVLHVAGGSEVTLGPVGPVSLPLPYALLHLLPPIGLIRTPSRFIVMTFFFLAPVVGAAVDWMSRKFRRTGGAALALVPVALIIFDYFPRGIETFDVSSAPVPVKLLALSKDRYAVAPINLHYSEHMRWAPLHGKPQTAGYVSRDTLYGRPIQLFSVNTIRALTGFSLANPSSDRLPAVADNVNKLLDAWGIGALLYKGSETQAKALARVLLASVLSYEQDLALIRLAPPAQPDPPGLEVTTENWPPMNNSGLRSSARDTVFRTGLEGFDFCVPDSLMPEGQIYMRAWSAARSIPYRQLQMTIFCNRQEIATVELPAEQTEFFFRLPPGTRRLGVNIISVRTWFKEPDATGASVPFALDVSVAGAGATERTTVIIDGQAVTHGEPGTPGIHFASIQPGSDQAPVSGSFAPDAGGIQQAAGALNLMPANRWAVLTTSGAVDPESSSALIEALQSAGIAQAADLLSSQASVIILPPRDRSDYRGFSADKGLLRVISNTPSEPPLPFGPVANIELMRFR